MPENKYKYVIRLSFLFVFISIITSVFIYRYFMLQTLGIRTVGMFNYQIANNYIGKVWNSNIHHIQRMSNNKPDKQVISFIKDSLNYFNNFGVLINIYDVTGNKLISNYRNKIVPEVISSKKLHSLAWRIIDNQLLEKDMDNKLAFTLSSNGQIRHIISPYNMLTTRLGKGKKIAFITSYIPLQINNNTVAVLEILTDVTEQWHDIQRLTKEMLIGFLGIFLLFSIIIIHNTKIAQRIIDQQSEVNNKLQEAKLRAEIESTAKTEFLANVSHELRTPLNAIIGFSEMMINENYNRINTVQYKEYIQDINNSGKHLLSVINDILDFSKASVDQLQIEKIDLNLNKTLISSMRFIKPRADIAKIKLITELPSEQIVIKADPRRLKQALLNLLSNSVKFTSEEGSIIIKVHKNVENKLVEIKVIDTGIGMSEQDIPKALSSFGQIDNKLNRKYEGTGLGLPLTKKLIELMGGEFKLESKIGIGTTASIIFRYNE